jgi:hypothetical protein
MENLLNQFASEEVKTFVKCLAPDSSTGEGRLPPQVGHVLAENEYFTGIFTQAVCDYFTLLQRTTTNIFTRGITKQKQIYMYLVCRWIKEQNTATADVLAPKYHLTARSGAGLDHDISDEIARSVLKGALLIRAAENSFMSRLSVERNTTLRNERDNLRNERDNVLQANTTLINDMDNLRNDVDNLLQEVQRLRERIERRNLELLEKDARIERRNLELLEKAVELQRLRADCEKLWADREQLWAEVQQLRSAKLRAHSDAGFYDLLCNYPGGLSRTLRFVWIAGIVVTVRDTIGDYLKFRDSQNADYKNQLIAFMAFANSMVHFSRGKTLHHKRQNYCFPPSTYRLWSPCKLCGAPSEHFNARRRWRTFSINLPLRR